VSADEDEDVEKSREERERLEMRVREAGTPWMKDKRWVCVYVSEGFERKSKKIEDSTTHLTE
jgi:hypothetical protein